MEKKDGRRRAGEEGRAKKDERRTDGRAEGRADGRKDGRTKGRTEGRKDGGRVERLGREKGEGG